MKKEMDKKAQGFSIGTLLALIVGAVLLVLIVFATTGAFGDWKDWAGGSKSNVAAVVFNCQQKCSTQDTRGYCVEINDVVFEKGGKSQKLTCKQLESYPNSGLALCDKIDCTVESVTCDRLKVLCTGVDKCDVVWMDQTAKTNAVNDKTTYKEVNDITVRVTDINDKNAHSNQFCVETIKN